MSATTMTTTTNIVIDTAFLAQHAPVFHFPPGMKAAAKPKYALAMWLSLLPLNPAEAVPVPPEAFADPQVLAAFDAFYVANLKAMNTKPKPAPKPKAAPKPRAKKAPAEASAEAPAAAAEAAEAPAPKKRAPRKKAAPAPVSEPVASEPVVSEPVASEPQLKNRAPRKKAAPAPQPEPQSDSEPVPDSPTKKQAAQAAVNQLLSSATPSPTRSQNRKTPTAPKKKPAETPAETDDIASVHTAVLPDSVHMNALELDTLDDDEDDEDTEVVTREYTHNGVLYRKDDEDNLYEHPSPHAFVCNLHDQPSTQTQTA